MTLSTAMVAGEAFLLIRTYAPQWRAQALNAQNVMANNSVNTDFVFQVLNALNNVVANLTIWKSVSGLDAYATSMGYPTTMSADCTATVNAAQTCINWVVANFPASGGFLLAESLNADGTRTPRSFTSAATTGMQSDLAALAATISP